MKKILTKPWYPSSYVSTLFIDDKSGIEIIKNLSIMFRTSIEEYIFLPVYLSSSGIDLPGFFLCVID